MTLTAEQKAIYETRLASAEEAFHNLNLGGQPRVYVDQNGERVEYTVANSQRLRAYIMELKQLLGLPTGVVGPMRGWIVR